MTELDTAQLAQLRLLRDNISAALNVAEEMNDTLLGALLVDIEHSLSERIGVLVTRPDGESAEEKPTARFTVETGYGRKAV